MVVESTTFGRTLVVSSDLKGYGRGNDKRHETMQAEFVRIQQAATQAAGLNRDAWERQPGGDGELAVLPAGEPEISVIDQYVRELGKQLRDYNADLPLEERLRLRVAMAFGTAYPAANGYAGQAVVEASRLLSCRPLKLLLDRRPEVDLALILSQRVFDETVRQGHTSYSVSEFREVQVQEKEYVSSAWIRVAGIDVSDLSSLFAETEPEPSGPSPRHVVGAMTQKAEVITNLYGAVDARNAVFGVSGK